MKYSVEFNSQNGVFTEILEIDGCLAQKEWKRQPNGEINSLCSSDLDFSEKFKDILNEEQCELISDLFDDSMLFTDIICRYRRFCAIETGGE